MAINDENLYKCVICEKIKKCREIELTLRSGIKIKSFFCEYCIKKYLIEV